MEIRRVSLGAKRLRDQPASRAAPERSKRTAPISSGINAAKEFLDDFAKNELAKQAVHMLEWYDGQAEYEIAPGQKAIISYAEVLAALARNGTESRDHRDTYIRDCFHWFFYSIDRVQHYINRGLIDFEDVGGIFKIYAIIMHKNWKIYDAFLSFQEHDLACHLFVQSLDYNEAHSSPVWNRDKV